MKLSKDKKEGRHYKPSQSKLLTLFFSVTWNEAIHEQAFQCIKNGWKWPNRVWEFKVAQKFQKEVLQVELELEHLVGTIQVKNSGASKFGSMFWHMDFAWLQWDIEIWHIFKFLAFWQQLIGEN